MTPEEINRTIEFILQIQARIEVTQEKHTETLQEMAVQGKRISELIVIGSRRLDEAQRENQAAQTRFEAWEKRHGVWEERHEAWEKRQDTWQKRHDELMREIRNGIDRIIDRLGGTH